MSRATIDHPYRSLPDRAFWRRSVSDRLPEEIGDLYLKKFEITPDMRISAAGSCFAQHISARLRERGFHYLDAEPRPVILPRSRAQEFGYEIYSARFGNIYTARQLLQLVLRARGRFVPEEEAWETNGRWYDPFRPTVEPNGFGSREELIACRDTHLRRVAWMLHRTDLLIFTLGLTEAWVSKLDGAVYPICPGTHAGAFDPDRYEFKNFTHAEILKDMRTFIQIATRIRPTMKFLLTVSPVSLVATAADDHVMVATTYSKSVLRGVAGELRDTFECVDYFPSYEIITAPAMRGAFYEDDMRSVTRDGVDFVMRQFFDAHPPPANIEPRAEAEGIQHDVVCDEIILEESAAQ